MEDTLHWFAFFPLHCLEMPLEEFKMSNISSIAFVMLLILLLYLKGLKGLHNLRTSQTHYVMSSLTLEF